MEKLGRDNLPANMGNPFLIFFYKGVIEHLIKTSTAFARRLPLSLRSPAWYRAQPHVPFHDCAVDQLWYENICQPPHKPDPDVDSTNLPVSCAEKTFKTTHFGTTNTFKML